MLTPVLITSDELYDICSYCSQATYIYYPVSNSYFSDLFNTGCRPLELLDQTRWNYISSSIIELIPLKGNAPRYFIESQLSTNLVFAIQNNIRPYDGLSYRQLKSVLYKILPVPEVTTEIKSSIDYIFRYNLVRQLSLAGMSDSDIAIYFGWSTSLLALSYRTQFVYSLGPVPPIATYFVVDNANSPLIDYNGDHITQ